MGNKLERVSDSKPQAEALSPLEAIALSDKAYWAKVREYVNWQTGEYIKGELAGSVIAALIVGVLALVAGEATLKAASWAILTLFAAFIAAVVVHFLRAHSAINAVANRRYLSTRDELAAEHRYKLFLKVITGLKMGRDGDPWEPYHSGISIDLAPDVFQLMTDGLRRSQTIHEINVTIYVQFDNRETAPARVENVKAHLIFGDEAFDVTDLEISAFEDGRPTTIKDRPIAARELSGEIRLDCEGRVDIDKKPLMDQKTYLRLILLALGQTPYCVDLTVFDWGKVWNPESSVMLHIKEQGRCSPSPIMQLYLT